MSSQSQHGDGENEILQKRRFHRMTHGGGGAPQHGFDAEVLDEGAFLTRQAAAPRRAADDTQRACIRSGGHGREFALGDGGGRPRLARGAIRFDRHEPGARLGPALLRPLARFDDNERAAEPSTSPASGRCQSGCHAPVSMTPPAWYC